MAYNYNLLNRINEAKIERTIDPKLWASVSSGCSKTYKNDLGKTAKPMGTREQLLQRFVAGLIILKQQCPITENDMRNCPAFTLWSKKLLEMGVTMEEVHKLWNENCGKLPKVDSTITSADNDATDINVEEDDADIMTGVSIDDEEDDYELPLEYTKDNQEIPAGTAATDDTADSTEYELPMEDTEDEIPDVTVNEPNIKSYQKDNKSSNLTAKFDSDPYMQLESVHTLLFGRGSQFENLHGCVVPEEALKHIPSLNASREGINKSAELNQLTQLGIKGNIFVMRVYSGGSDTEVCGDVVWNQLNTQTAYYVAVTNDSVKIFYKNEAGDLSLAYEANHDEFGFTH